MSSTQLDLTAIREAVAAAINAGVNTTIRSYAFEADAPVFPAAMVLPGRDKYVAYHESFGLGAGEVSLVVQLLVQRGNAKAADRQLDLFLSSGQGQTCSVVDALVANRTLTGTVQDVLCIGARRLQDIQWPSAPGAPVIITAVAELDLRVWVKRS